MCASVKSWLAVSSGGEGLLQTRLQLSFHICSAPSFMISHLCVVGLFAFLILQISVSATERVEGEGIICVAGVSYMCYLRKVKVH